MRIIATREGFAGAVIPKGEVWFSILILVWFDLVLIFAFFAGAPIQGLVFILNKFHRNPMTIRQ